MLKRNKRSQKNRGRTAKENQKPDELPLLEQQKIAEAEWGKRKLNQKLKLKNLEEWLRKPDKSEAVREPEVACEGTEHRAQTSSRAQKNPTKKQRSYAKEPDIGTNQKIGLDVREPEKEAARTRGSGPVCMNQRRKQHKPEGQVRYTRTREGGNTN